MIFLEVDPNVVKPGWTPLIITVVLAAVIVLLMLSMRRQMRKIDVPYRADLSGDGDAVAEDASVEDSPTEDETSRSPETAESSGAQISENGKRVGHSG